jgi:tetratricopeptide (TPR) repeat protein
MPVHCSLNRSVFNVTPISLNNTGHEDIEFIERMKLEPPDTHYLNAAQGWLGLGNTEEANAELEKIPPALQLHPEVLEVRWQTSAKARNWQQCVELGNRLVELAPKTPMGWIHRSYALHEMKQTHQALEALLPALAMFPEDWLIQYNLACYCCRLNQFERALRFLEQALKFGDTKQIKQMALGDDDLREIREHIISM